MADSLQAVASVAGAVPGVASASPHPEASGTLRVTLLPGADPAQVGLAVGRLLAEALEVVPEAAPAAGRVRSVIDLVPEPRRARPHIVRLDVHNDGPAFVVGVALSCGTRSSVGRARSSLTTAGVRRAAATATLHAVEELCPGPVHFELELVERSDAGHTPVVVVHVTSVWSDGVQRLVGSAAVREDETRAVVRAALDAVNRRVEALLQDEAPPQP